MKIEKGILLSIDNNDIKNGELTIPSNVTKIGNECGRSISELKKVISFSVTSMGNHNFRECENLEVVEMPLLKKMGYSNFMNCSHLKSVEMKSLKKKGSFNFQYCFSLGNLDIIEKIDRRENNIFKISMLSILIISLVFILVKDLNIVKSIVIEIINSIPEFLNIIPYFLFIVSALSLIKVLK